MKIKISINKSAGKSRDWSFREGTDLIKGNTRILALSHSGMVIQAGIDANESIEKQDYAVTEFGRMVDCYAISLENDERQQYYRKNQSETHTFGLGIKPVSEEKIKALFDD